MWIGTGTWTSPNSKLKRGSNQSIRARVCGISESLTAWLSKAGLKRVDRTANPDFEVLYNAGVKEHTIVEDYDSCIARTPGLTRGALSDVSAELSGNASYFGRGSGEQFQ